MNRHADIDRVFQDFESISNSYWPYVIAFLITVVVRLRSYMGGPTCPSNERMDGKIVIITGASSGLGRETAIELARRGGHIILAVKDVESGEKVAKTIREISGGSAEVMKLDLSSLENVCDFVRSLSLDRIDVLINNAGIVFHPFEKTSEGFEKHFVTNYLGHFLLTQALIPKLMNSEQGRIINISARIQADSDIFLNDLNLEKNFSAKNSFGQSKLALILMARCMSKSLQGTKITINAVDPGLVRGTKHLRISPLNSTYLIKLFMMPWMWLLLKNPVQGAQTSVYAAVSSDLNDKSGLYLRDCEVTLPAANARDDDLAEKLFEKSMKLLDFNLRSLNLKNFPTR